MTIHRVTSTEEWERLTGEPAGGVLVVSPWRKPRPPKPAAPVSADPKPERKTDGQDHL